MIVEESVQIEQIVVDGTTIYWSERHSKEAGRTVIQRLTTDGRITTITPPFIDHQKPYFNVRTRVHEYGGGAFTVSGGVVYFSNFNDQQLYRQESELEPVPVTDEAQMFYADGVIDRDHKRLYCVRENHSREGEAVNTLICLNLKNGSTTVITSGNDFYSSPRLNHDGTKLAWTTWNHPHMPWDETELWIANVKKDGYLSDATKIAGVTGESIMQPQWSPEGMLYYISDRNGWWNIYRWDGSNVKPLFQMEAEFAAPQWLFGLSSYAIVSPGQIFCTYFKDGLWHLSSIDTVKGEMKEIETPYTAIQNLKTIPNAVVFTGGSPHRSTEIVKLDTATYQYEVLYRPSKISVDEDYISVPEQIEYQTGENLTSYGNFYAPKNRDYVAPNKEKPPLLVITHGGPTSAADTSLNLNIQYWTSRGFAVFDVNYGGSTGYGRAYRERLKEKWGIIDVDDVINGALYLVQQNRVDGEKLSIRGGSAGGYTTLACLAFRSGVFKAGASYYGVSELGVLTALTHKFESRYLDGLIGPYKPPLKPGDPYYDRSPIYFTDQINAPLILFQGDEDKIVPPEQSRMMVESLAKKGLPHAYIEFKGEGHGFRKAENVIRSLEAELYFYSKIFGFEPADNIQQVSIINLK
jgi:dipeptidyl aminopeptidase/acylaminoacyl peptidase